jgi:hypothetical protein
MTDIDDDRALVDDDGHPSKWEWGGCVSSTARQANWSTTTQPGTGVWWWWCLLQCDRPESVVVVVVVADLSVGVGSVRCVGHATRAGPQLPGGESVMTDLDTTVTVIEAAARAHVPVLLWSDPGYGKSAMVRALAAADGVAVETVIGSQREPVDIAGWPVVTDGAVQTLALPDWGKPSLTPTAGTCCWTRFRRAQRRFRRRC